MLSHSSTVSVSQASNHLEAESPLRAGPLLALATDTSSFHTGLSRAASAIQQLACWAATGGDLLLILSWKWFLILCARVCLLRSEQDAAHI